MVVDSISDYNALDPHAFHCCRAMRVLWSGRAEDRTVGNPVMDGCPYYPFRIEFEFVRPGEAKEVLALRFDGIHKLVLPDSEAQGLGPISVLEIKDATDLGWDGIYYEVWGEEMDGDIGFYCRSFSAQIVQVSEE